MSILSLQNISFSYDRTLVLQNISYEFEKGKIYNEKEVNQILQPIFDDYMSLRRYLIKTLRKLINTPSDPNISALYFKALI